MILTPFSGPRGHEARHLLLGDFNFLPAEIGQADVFHLVIHTLQFPSFILRLISRQRSSGISEPTTLTTSELTSAP